MGILSAVTESGTSAPRGATLLRGGGLATRVRGEVQERAEALRGAGAPPRLRVLLVGEDGASETYVAAKTRAAREAGIEAETVRLSRETGEAGLLAQIEEANADPRVDGLLVQLPLPTRALAERVFDALDPHKDVDGLHPENAGLLLQGRPRFVPCTPAGVVALLEDHGLSLAGTRAVILGRSDIVGRPLAALLTARDATVTLCHSSTRDLPEICRQADILVAATGRAGLVRGDWIKPGATVVDVGVNRLRSLHDAPAHLRGSERLRAALAQRGEALVGDVAFEEALGVAGAITPVPGGIGPLTVAMLLRNTVTAAELRRRRT